MSNSSSGDAGPVAVSSSRTKIKIIKFVHVWTIENFSFFSNEYFIQSSTFRGGADDGAQWHLRLFPRSRGEDDKDYVSLFLNLNSCDQSKIQVKYVFSIKATKKLQNENCLQDYRIGDYREPITLELGDGHGHPRFILRDELFTDPRGFVADDKLIVTCEVSYAKDSTELPSQSPRERCEVLEYNPSAVLDALHESKRYSDVVLSLNGKEFRANKSILAVRSPVFKAIFDQDCDKEKTSWIEISDMEEDTFRKLLRFIYTGEADVVDNMLNLLVSIDKHVSRKTTPIANS